MKNNNNKKEKRNAPLPDLYYETSTLCQLMALGGREGHYIFPLWCFLTGLMDETYSVEVSFNTMSKQFPPHYKLSRQALRHGVKVLEENGYLRIEKEGKSNRYYANPAHVRLGSAPIGE